MARQDNVPVVALRWVRSESGSYFRMVLAERGVVVIERHTTDAMGIPKWEASDLHADAILRDIGMYFGGLARKRGKNVAAAALELIETQGDV